MAMKVVTPSTTTAAVVMKAAHALARRWMSEFVIVGEYRDILRSALKFAWDCIRGKAGIARLPRFAAATPRVWRNVVVAAILAAKGATITTNSRHTLPWLKEEGLNHFQLGWVPIRMIPSLLSAATVGYAYCAASGKAGVFWN